MDSKTPNWVAVDVAKDSLQIQTEQRGWVVANTTAGLTALIRQLRLLPAAHVVCEASGGYERALLAHLHQAHLPVSLVNPARVRAFAHSEGLRAKTDPLDARVLRRFALEKRPRPTPPPAPQQMVLVALLDRRAHLSEQLAREKNRLHKSAPVVHASIQEMIQFVQQQLTEVEQRIRQLVDQDAHWRARVERLCAVQGIGEVTAWTIVAYLSEVTHLKRNQLVALVGLAPWNRDSGRHQGRRAIAGGRAKVRKCLYMAAQTAARHNPVIREYVARLTAREKPYKWVMVAAMRKLLLHIQSLLKQQELALAS